MSRKIITKNRSAFHDYQIFDKFCAGMVLSGTEIKSIRNNAINLKDSFVKVEKNEAFLYNCHISQYVQGNRYNHDEKRVRKLLLNKKEILKIVGRIKKEGYAIIPLEIFLENGWAKIEIALAKGKKLYDKRDDLKKKSQTRHIQCAMRKKYY